MGDRTNVIVTFGGEMTQNTFNELVNEIRRLDDHYWFETADWDKVSSINDLGEYLKESPTICADEINYAEIPELTEFCQSKGICYEVEWAAGGCYGPGRIRWTPTKTTECPLSGGTALAGVYMIKQHAHNIEALIEELEFDIPDLKIV